MRLRFVSSWVSLRDSPSEWSCSCAPRWSGRRRRPVSTRHYDPDMSVTRRQFTRALGSAGIALAFERWLDAQPIRPVAGGRLTGTMPLGRFDRRPAPPLNVLLGTGLDARQFTDLSAIDGTSPVTPVERFYIRTSHPPELP